MSEKYNIPRGTFDILPENSYKWQYVFRIFRELAAAYNYREIITPIFENSNLFERAVGDSTDIVEKEMYKFQDKKGRELALRPEGTAPVVRSYINNNLQNRENSSKLYYLGPMFRYDKPQKGRFRQFYQYGVENFGSKDPFIDAEVIALGYNFLKKLGLQNFVLEINSIGCSECSKDYDAALVEYFTKYTGDLCNDCKNRLKTKPKRILDCKIKRCKEIAENAPSQLDYLDESCRTDFEQVQDYLVKMNIPFLVNPKIVRGLDYYTKTAFEYLNNNLGAQNALGGGGRYDNLVEQMGGNPTPGIGFAGGFERLILSMETEGLDFGGSVKPFIYFITLGEKAELYAISLLEDLRNSGLSLEFDADKKSLKAQMKAADRSKAEFALILGDDELENNEITLKNMTTGKQQKIALDTTKEYLLNLKKKSS
ncbi:MAG: histidine--tRNA ligase [Candidatus Cloacimonas sp. SDB]|nr:MAG: histidine--tRNA ligase [Candidatus Cloacimonas sp. SDB]